MRLTLRTLLAYLDDMLEPADAEMIGQKIEESEFASSVVQRVRDVTRRLRLEAPRLRGRSMGVDPNTVAEYLDSTLSPERVPDFEKLCLESDVYLAEVASCHQILTLVLAEPAEVSPDCRQRMYGLIHQPMLGDDGAEHDNEYHVAPSEAPPPISLIERPKPEIPEYLRQEQPGRSWWWQAAILAGLMALIGGAVWMAIRPGQAHKVALVADPGAKGAQPVEGAAAGEGKQAGSGQPGAPGTASPADEAPASPAGRAAESGLATGESAASPTEPTRAAATGAGLAEATLESSATEALDATTAPAPDDAATPPVPEADPFDEPGGAAAATAPLGEPRTLSQPGVADRSAAEATLAEPVGATSDEPPLPGAADAANTGAATGDADAEPTPDGEATSPTPAVDVAEQLTPERGPVGRYVSTSEVLLRRAAADAPWERMNPQEVVNAGDLLITPATYRTTVTLGVGLTVQVLGRSRVTWLAPDDAGLAGLALDFGRVVLMNTGRGGTRLRIAAGEIHGVLTFSDAETSIALEVRPARSPGSNPEEVPSTWSVTAYADSGESTWRGEMEAADTTLAAPAMRRLSSAGLEPVEGDAASFPDWINAERLKPIEDKASTALEQALVGDRPVALRLKELVDQRKEEVRALAVCTLGLMEDFGSFVTTLDDPRQRSYWSEQFDLLVQAVGVSAENARRVHDMLSEARGAAEGDELFRMLWGYSPDELRGAEGRRLVGYLDHEDQVFRVLAFQNLQRAAGKSLSYRPDDSPAQRRLDVQRWRELYESGELGAAEPAR